MYRILAALKGKSLTVNINALIPAIFASLKALGVDVMPEDPETFVLLYGTGVAAINIIIRIFKTKKPIEEK